jgi:hypothetical protein
MRNRTQGVLAFATIFATCVAGILHYSWWAALAGGCVLALISISNHPLAYRALGGGQSVAGVLLFSSFFNAAVISAAALAAGRAIGWAWGI